jgi:hypothetical protein
MPSPITPPHNPLNQNDEQDIKAHPFFAGVQWETLHAARAPYTPRVDHELDTQVLRGGLGGGGGGGGGGASLGLGWAGLGVCFSALCSSVLRRSAP